MLGHVLGCWKETVQPLVSGDFDVSGAFYLESHRWVSKIPNFGPASYFAGNFWWATSAHIRRLPSANAAMVDATRYVDRYFAELWVTMAPHRAFSQTRNVWPKMSNCVKARLIHAVRKHVVALGLEKHDSTRSVQLHPMATGR
jgi:hypothetical protein